jgi:hypothetical protein
MRHDCAAQRPNIFQRLTRQWSAVYPFNGAQVVILSEETGGRDWDGAWRLACQDLGLGRLLCAGGRYRHEALGCEMGKDCVCHEGGTSLEEVIEKGMNQRISLAETGPFRPFVGSLAGQHCAGIIYEHWVADSLSVRMVMRRWLERALEGSDACNPRPMRWPAGGFARHFGPQTGAWNPVPAILDGARFVDRMRRVRALKIVESSPWRTGFLIARGTDGLLDRLKAAARAMGATVNDLLVAAALEAVARELPIANRSKRRRDWAVGSIVDLRRQGNGLADVFGNFLGFTAAFARPAEVTDWRRLVAVVNRQTRRDKQTGAAAASCMMMAVALAARCVLDSSKTAYFCRLHAPLTAGVSNVNLTRQWPSRWEGDPIVDWVRASPTGPMAPLVFAVTSFGRGLSIGVTFRESIVNRATAQRVTDAFLDRLERIHHPPLP